MNILNSSQSFYRVRYRLYLNDIMQVGAKHKKFTHNRMKACIQRNQQEDKENILHYQDFRNKKLSVQLPSRCIDPLESCHKSIFNQQISVTLNTSTTKTYDKDIITVDVKTLSHLLNRQQAQVPLRQLLAESDPKSIEVKLLVDRMLNYLRSEESYHCSSMSSQKQAPGQNHQQLNSTLMKPYIQREIEVLCKNLDQLVKERQNYREIKSISSDSKQSVLNSLKEMYQTQLKQLQQLQ